MAVLPDHDRLSRLYPFPLAEDWSFVLQLPVMAHRDTRLLFFANGPHRVHYG